jgi:hypothetical protein
MMTGDALLTFGQLIQQTKEGVPKQLRGLLEKPDGAAELVQLLPKLFSPGSVSEESSPAVDTWNRIGKFFSIQKRYYESLAIYTALYDQMLAFQEEAGTRCHKGLPLIRMSDCYFEMGYGLISSRYLMLTLVEDAILEKGSVNLKRSGIYRLVWWGRLSDREYRRYAESILRQSQTDEVKAFYPEWVLQQIDTEWITQAPSFQEAGVFAANPRYIRYLVAQLADRSGKNLELLAGYLVSCMPGCRIATRQRSWSFEYDLVCSVEGLELDFRSELGRYFVCECKDWQKPADVTTMAKLCRVLDSVKSRFGILFSKEGVSGRGRRKDAEIEQLKVFQDRGIVIVVVDLKDLERLAQGANFISILRSKYERVRLNLIESTGTKSRSKKAKRRLAP